MYMPKLARFTARDPLAQNGAVLLGGLSQHAYGYANNNPVNNIDPSGLIVERELDWCELCIYSNFLSVTVKNAIKHGLAVVQKTKVVSHVTILNQIQNGEFEKFLSKLSTLTLKGQVAQISFKHGGAGAITLGTEIHTKAYVRGCGPVKEPPCCKTKLRQREAAITDLPDVALIAHELVHVVQQLNLGETEFYKAYIKEWKSWMDRGASGKRAYQCISYEIAGHAMQDVIKTFFSDPKRRETFNEACCEDKEVPDRHVKIVKAGFERRVEAETKKCNKEFPKK